MIIVAGTMLGARCDMIDEREGSLLSGVYIVVFSTVTDQTLYQEYFQTLLVSTLPVTPSDYSFSTPLS